MTVTIPEVNIYTQNPWLERIHPEKALFRGEAYEVAKRLLDVFILIIGLPVWLPLLAVCALLIKIESPQDPAMFVQERTGRGGKRFKMYKFRTMVVHAEEIKSEIMHLNELMWPDFKIADDPRVTRMGRFLRITSLDELPQVFNVIKNDMSLVGPRPTSFSPEVYALWHTERLDVMPGITGLWQILGRGSTEFDERLKMDIAYIEKRCLWLDFQILIRTVIAVFQNKGAY
ncbi:MAG: sugar transferase [Chloroflexota bacterium]